MPSLSNVAIHSNLWILHTPAPHQSICTNCIYALHSANALGKLSAHSLNMHQRMPEECPLCAGITFFFHCIGKCSLLHNMSEWLTCATIWFYSGIHQRILRYSTSNGNPLWTDHSLYQVCVALYGIQAECCLLHTRLDGRGHSLSTCCMGTLRSKCHRQSRP